MAPTYLPPPSSTAFAGHTHPWAGGRQGRDLASLAGRAAATSTTSRFLPAAVPTATQPSWNRRTRHQEGARGGRKEPVGPSSVHRHPHTSLHCCCTAPRGPLLVRPAPHAGAMAGGCALPLARPCVPGYAGVAGAGAGARATSGQCGTIPQPSSRIQFHRWVVVGEPGRAQAGPKQGSCRRRQLTRAACSLPSANTYAHAQAWQLAVRCVGDGGGDETSGWQVGGGDHSHTGPRCGGGAWSTLGTLGPGSAHEAGVVCVVGGAPLACGGSICGGGPPPCKHSGRVLGPAALDSAGCQQKQQQQQ